MSKHKAKELEGNLHRLPEYTPPPPDRIPHWKVWRFALANPGVDVFKGRRS